LPVEEPAVDINGQDKRIGPTNIGYASTRARLLENSISALSNLRFSVAFINCTRRGTDNVSRSKSVILPGGSKKDYRSREKIGDENKKVVLNSRLHFPDGPGA
jgi:hypothetical protein